MSRDCGSFTENDTSPASPPMKTNAFSFTLKALCPHGKSSRTSGKLIAYLRMSFSSLRSDELAFDVDFMEWNPQCSERLADLIGVADDDDEGAIGIDVLLRDARDVILRDRGDVLAVTVEIVVGKVVQLHVEHAAGDVARALHGGRENAHQVALRVVELA